MLGLAGWYSTNILGNRDGEVLDDPASFKTKEESKLSVLHTILQPEKYPALYQGFSHVVRINYYPPRGDNKEGWDNIDIVGWMGLSDADQGSTSLCRDSILAAPLVLDLALFSDFAQARGHEGHSGMALLLLQEPNDGRGSPGRATISSSSRRSSRTRCVTSWVKNRSRTSDSSTTSHDAGVFHHTDSRPPWRCQSQLRRWASCGGGTEASRASAGETESYMFTITSDPIPPHARASRSSTRSRSRTGRLVNRSRTGEGTHLRQHGAKVHAHTTDSSKHRRSASTRPSSTS